MIAIVAIAKGSKAFACAWTGNTIVRSAGKLAILAWSRPMTGEPVRVVLHLDQDSRLVGVLCSAVEHQAAHAGFETAAGAQLAKAAGDVCLEAISQGGADGSGIDVTLETFLDRMEIAIHCRGKVHPTVGLEKFTLSSAQSGGAHGLNGQELLSCVDRVLYAAEGGIARTTLVKFLPAHP